MAVQETEVRQRGRVRRRIQVKPTCSSCTFWDRAAQTPMMPQIDAAPCMCTESDFFDRMVSGGKDACEYHDQR